MWTTLVLVAHLFLAIATATARTVPAPAGLIPLTLNEFRHLFAALVITPALPVRQVGLFRTGDGDTSTAPRAVKITINCWSTSAKSANQRPLDKAASSPGGAAAQGLTWQNVGAPAPTP